MSPPTYTIHLIPPPSPTLLPLIRHLCLPSSFPSPSNPSTSPTSPSSSTLILPPHLTTAMRIRIAVFVDEQSCSAEEEIDEDDARSWHWVLYASSPSPVSPPTPAPAIASDESGAQPPHTPASTNTHPPNPTPASTIRLVPVHGTAGASAHWAIRPGWGVPNYGASDTWDGVEGYVKIGRLATVREARGRGLGRLLVEEVVGWVRGNPGVVGRGVRGAREGEGQGEENGEGEEDRRGWKGLIGCHAQKHLEGWYGTLGFVRDEGMGEWEEDGIPHVGMWRRMEV